MQQFDSFINGEFIKSTPIEITEILNPCTEEVLSTIPYSSREDANKVLNAAKNAHHAWKSLTAITRANYLNKMAIIIRENRIFLAKTNKYEQEKHCGYEIS
jgi:lactaldehyde dehydrogenase/glycolaldehyde dehydrogenase